MESAQQQLLPLAGPIVMPGAGEKGGFSNKHLLGNSAIGVRSQKNS